MRKELFNNRELNELHEFKNVLKDAGIFQQRIKRIKRIKAF